MNISILFSIQHQATSIQYRLASLSLSYNHTELSVKNLKTNKVDELI